MKLESQRTGDLLLVRVDEARIDAACAIAFKDEMRSLTVDAPPRVVLDMAKVGFLDSSGLGAIVAVMKACAPESRLELAALTPMVEKVFRLTRMTDVFRIHPTPEAALTNPA